MGTEIRDYLENLTKLLNGQLRGAINAKAREENAELVYMTLSDAFEKGQEYGIAITTEKYAIENLKQQLKDEEEPVKPKPSKNQVD